MRTSTVRILAYGSAAVAVMGLALTPLARSQVLAIASYVPIGVSASGNASTAWFHDPSSRQALACQTVTAPGTGLSAIQCVTTKLP